MISPLSEHAHEHAQRCSPEHLQLSIVFTRVKCCGKVKMLKIYISKGKLNTFTLFYGFRRDRRGLCCFFQSVSETTGDVSAGVLSAGNCASSWVLRSSGTKTPGVLKNVTLAHE